MTGRTTRSPLGMSEKEAYSGIRLVRPLLNVSKAKSELTSNVIAFRIMKMPLMRIIIMYEMTFETVCFRQ